MFFGTGATTCFWALVTVVGPANGASLLGSRQSFSGYLDGSPAPVATGLIVRVDGSFVPALFAASAYFLLIRGPIVHHVPSTLVAAG
jgi:hypothetical protein